MLNKIKCWFKGHDFIYNREVSRRNFIFFDDTYFVSTEYKCSCCEKIYFEDKIISKMEN